MWAEYGQFSLCLAFAAALLTVISTFRKDALIASAGASAALKAQFIALLCAFICLVMAFIISDFSVTLVASNSHSEKPLLYKIAGTWGNHEGSMLLWMLLLSAYCASFAYLKISKAETSKIEYRVLGLICVAIIVFILAASNPFLRMDTVPIEGRGLNPLLQDWGLAIHPPILYAGYVGFAVPYAMAIGTLFSGAADRQWARQVLPWVMTPLAFLTLGVGLGSWWAYRELGWGGFWFWDPVENASLLPWLFGAAMAHGAFILKRTGALGQSTLLLAILTFSLSILGTFLVRSGVLTSVHSFAVDPKRGLLIFIFLMIVLGGGLGVFWTKRSASGKPITWPLTSRLGFMAAGIGLLLTIAGTVLLGTLYPLAIDALGAEPITVGAPYFNATARPLGWLMVGIMVLAPFALWTTPLTLTGIIQDHKGGLISALVGVIAATLTLQHFQTDIWQALLFGVSVFFCGLVVTFAISHAPKTLSGMSMIFAHGGIALAALGMTGAAFFSSETIVSVKPGDQFETAQKTLVFGGVERGKGANYFYDRATVKILDAAGHIKNELTPERRWYPAGNMTTSEAMIDRTVIRDFYVTLGDLRTPGADAPDWALRVYDRPFISWIWLGCILTFLGSGFSAIHHFRRRRVASSMPAKAAPTHLILGPAE